MSGRSIRFRLSTENRCDEVGGQKRAGNLELIKFFFSWFAEELHAVCGNGAVVCSVRLDAASPYAGSMHAPTYTFTGDDRA